MTYDIDLKALIHILHEFSFSGKVECDLFHTLGFRGNRFRAEVRLRFGKIVACQVLYEDGSHLFDHAALDMLEKAGELSWTLTTSESFLGSDSQQTVPLLALTTPILHSTVPKRRDQVTSQDIAVLPPFQKWIFTLVDGKRNVDEIARILASSRVATIIEALEDLRAKSFIVTDASRS